MQYPKQVLLGIGLGTLTMVVLSLLPPEKTLEFASMLLVFIAAPYIGFALSDGRQRELAIEIGAIIGFCLLAVLGLWLNPYLLVAGLVLHGIWDLIHHPRQIQTQIVAWYPPFCAVYDWLVGGYLLVWLLI